jgi:hypothetical protein
VRRGLSCFEVAHEADADASRSGKLVLPKAEPLSRAANDFAKLDRGHWLSSRSVRLADFCDYTKRIFPSGKKWEFFWIFTANIPDREEKAHRSL